MVTSALLRDQRDQIWIIKTETKTEKVWVSMTRPRPRLKMSESQWLDWDRDWKDVSLKDETETENFWVSMKRLRLRPKNHSLNDETETKTEKIWDEGRDWNLTDICHSISGEGNDTCPLKINRLVGLDFFSPTGLTQPFEVGINELILMEFI